MNLSIVTAHTRDFHYMFRTQYAMMKLNDPTVKIVAAKSNAIEQFKPDVDWVDLEMPDFIHEDHKKFAVKINFGRPILAKNAKADRVAWVDGDILSLENNSMTDFLLASDRPTVANPVPYGKELLDGWNWLANWFGYSDVPCYNCGLVGAPGDDEFWDEWFDTMKTLYLSKLDELLSDIHQPYHYEIPLRLFCIDQMSLNIIIQKNPKRFNFVDKSYNLLPLAPHGDFFKDYIKIPHDTKMVHLTGTLKKGLLIDPESLNNVQSI